MVQRQMAGSKATSARPSMCDSARGSIRTIRPSSTTGLTQRSVTAGMLHRARSLDSGPSNRRRGSRLAMSAFTDLVADYLADSFRLDPLAATNAGNHDHDDRWPDWSSSGVAEHVEWVASMRRRLDEIAVADLTSDELIDRDRLRLDLDDRDFEARSGEDTWNALAWVYRLGDGLFTLLSREFAPPSARLASFAG